MKLARRSALAAVGEFATSLSHDVRNALTSIRVDLERVERAKIVEPVPRKLIERSLGSVMRLETSVTGALQVARAGHTQPVDVDVRLPIRAAVETVIGTIAAIPATLDVELADEPLVVHGSSPALQQVFANLLFNAAQALRPDGRAIITSRSREGIVEVLVADTGTGIDDETMAALSTPFFSSKPNGNGLGLPIARRIVAEHGGTLEIESVAGEGTVVCVRLPERHESYAGVERVVQADGPVGQGVAAANA